MIPIVQFDPKFRKFIAKIFDALRRVLRQRIVVVRFLVCNVDCFSKFRPRFGCVFYYLLGFFHFRPKLFYIQPTCQIRIIHRCRTAGGNDPFIFFNGFVKFYDCLCPFPKNIKQRLHYIGGTLHRKINDSIFKFAKLLGQQS